MHRRVFAFVIVGYIVYQQGYNGYHSHFFVIATFGILVDIASFHLKETDDWHFLR